MSRIVDILQAIQAGTTYTPNARSRAEGILKSIANNTANPVNIPQSRYEEILSAIKAGTPTTLTAQTRLESLLTAIANGTLDSWLVGKNLFDINLPTTLTNCSKTILYETITFQPTQQNGRFIFNKINVQQGKTYTVSCKDIIQTAGGLYISNIEQPDNYVYGRINSNTKSITFTATTADLYLKGYSNFGSISPFIIVGLKFELGSSATAYTPYAFTSELEEEYYKAFN